MAENENSEQPKDIGSLQESFSIQQKKISELKELVRKSESSQSKSTSEKVKSIAQRLTLLKSKARSRQNVNVQTAAPPQNYEGIPTAAEVTDHSLTMSLSEVSLSSVESIPKQEDMNKTLPVAASVSTSTSTSGFGLSGIDKVVLLRQQIEQNKLKMAKRASSKQHLEQLVSQLKEKFDTTQQWLDDTTELGKSMSDLSTLDYSQMARERHRSATDLSTQPFSLERERIKFLDNRCRLLEKQLEKQRIYNNNESIDTVAQQESLKRIQELENSLVELDKSLIESNNKIEQKNAENESLRKELEEKHKLIEQLSAQEPEANEIRNENERLRNEIEEKGKRIVELEEIADILEAARSDLLSKEKETAKQLEEFETELSITKSKLHDVKDKLRESEVKCLSLTDMVEKLQEDLNISEEDARSNTDSQVKAEMAKQIQELQEDIQELRLENKNLKEMVSHAEKIEITDSNIGEKITALEATIASQREDLTKRMELVRKYEEEAMEKTIELNVLNANFKVLQEKVQSLSKNKAVYSIAGYSETEQPDLHTENQQLKQKLDESNKVNIKLKLKCKQTEKQIEKLKRSSNLNADIIKLQEDNEKLQQKITELEDEKGQWQLTQVDEMKISVSEDYVEKHTNERLNEKLQSQAEQIKVLEHQVNEKAEKLQTLQQGNEDSIRVKSEMSEIHFEEQLNEQSQQIEKLQERLTAKENAFEKLLQEFKELQVQKQDVDKKLEHYLNENMELLDKVEKLSKSSSSAESIEIVERLTQQERAEIDAFNKRMEHEHTTGHAPTSVDELTQTEIGSELSEGLVKLREESSELMNKIELFTTERREVLEKMEHLTNENQEYIKQIDELTDQREQHARDILAAEEAKLHLEAQLRDLTKEKDLLLAQASESTVQKAQLSQELTSLQKSSEVVAALDSNDGATLFDKCEKSLLKLNSELESYRRANDKNAKFNASKKLAKEAKNAYTQLSELLQKVKEASNAVETVTVVETVVAVTAPNGKALAEYEQLNAQNRELKSIVEELRRELQDIHDNGTTSDAPHAAITDNRNCCESQEKLRRAEINLERYETHSNRLFAIAENLRVQLGKAHKANEENYDEIARLNHELGPLRKISDEFDRLVAERMTIYETQITALTTLRAELEGKCEAYKAELDILKTLVAEQKQQLIDIYEEDKDGQIKSQLIDLNEKSEIIKQLQSEIKDLKEFSKDVSEKRAEELRAECEKLRESLKINKNLVADQINELANKQETIDMLNQQIIDLYKVMEENTNKVIEKEDEINYLQELLDNNNKELERMRKDNEAQKSVVDKLLSELHSHQANSQQLSQLQSELQRLEAVNLEMKTVNQELEQRNKDQLEKLKKYAANLKKRTTQCQELEAKVNELEKGSLEAMQTKENSESLSELNERIIKLEEKLHDSESIANELKEALQTKTIEVLEFMEKNAKTEKEIEQIKEDMTQKVQEIVQLQNALAASQQFSDWDIPTGTTMAITDEQLKDVSEKSALMEQLQNELSNKTSEINDLRSQLESARDQLLSTVPSNNETDQNYIDELNNELKATKKRLEDFENEKVNCLALQQDVEQLQKKLQEYESKFSNLSEELKAKSLKFEKSKAVIKERNNQIHRLQTKLKELQDNLSSQPEEEQMVAPIKHVLLNAPPPASASVTLSATEPKVSKKEFDELREAYEKINEQYTAEKGNFQATIARLETLHDGIQAKLQENMAYIESLEQENTAFKDKICRLEECIATFEERRASVERRANLLSAQMQSQTDEYGKQEDELIYRLNMLSEHDEVIAQRLLNSQEEKEHLQDKVNRTLAELNELQTKYTKLENDFKLYRVNVVDDLEKENTALREQVENVKQEVQRVRSQFEAKLMAKTTEIDELECELSEQLGKMNVEKRGLTEDLERSRDECTEHKDEIVRLRESLNTLEQSKSELELEMTWLRMQHENSQQDQYTLQELRMQSMQDKTEIDNLRHQIETLSSNHEAELNELRLQISELDSLRMQVGQNQTDDQVFIETENKRLTDLLAEKQTLIENYQRQNLQLQMAATSFAQQQNPETFSIAFGIPTTSSTPPLPAQPVTSSTSTMATQTTSEERERWERELSEKNEQIARLNRDINLLETEFNNLVEGNGELQRQLYEQNREVERLRLMRSRSPSTNSMLNAMPAPPMLFANEQVTNPFDDIIQQPQQINANYFNLLDGAPPRQSFTAEPIESNNEQVIIQDLQRNVSDLEKHAQDLENKLTTRRLLEADQDERLRENQKRLQENDNRIQELQVKLQNAQLKLENVERDYEAQTQQLVDLQNELARVQHQLAQLQQTQPPSQEMSQMINILDQHLQERNKDLVDLRRALEELQEPEKDKQKDEIPKELQPTLDMFFGNVPQSDFIMPKVSDQPVVEDIIVPKKAYVCQPSNDELQPSGSSVFNFGNENDWTDSWAVNEAMAEAAHFEVSGVNINTNSSLLSREQQLEMQLNSEIERTQTLQLALERCEQQKQELQIKSGKLMKKLKEYKTKIDELQSATETSAFRKSTSVESNTMFDLDAAIQDELKVQIKKLEEKIAEQNQNHENWSIEKEKLLKRIDMLTAGNERMSEMKERQDMDVQMYQTRIRELQEKLSKLEDWDAAENAEGSLMKVVAPPLQTELTSTVLIEKSDSSIQLLAEQTNTIKLLEQRIKELEVELLDISADRQELQALLDDEKADTARLQETIKTLQQQLTAKENAAAANETLEKSKYSELEYEYKNLQQSYNELKDNAEKLEIDQQKLMTDNKMLLQQQQNEIATQKQQIQTLKETLGNSEKAFYDLQANFMQLTQQNNELTQMISELKSASVEENKKLENNELTLKLQKISAEKDKLSSDKKMLEKQVTELQEEIANTVLTTTTNLKAVEKIHDNEDLFAQLLEKDSEIMHLKQRVEDLMREDQTEKLVLEILTKNHEIHLLKMQVKHLEDDKEQLEQNLSFQVAKSLETNNVDDTAKLQAYNKQLEEKLKEMEAEHENMEEELKILNSHVLNSIELEDKLKDAMRQIDNKNIEVAKLQQKLNEVQANNSNNINNNLPTTMPDNLTTNREAELKTYWEGVVEEKCSEIARMWREHLEQREHEFKESETRLNDEIAILQKKAMLQKPISHNKIVASTSFSDTTSGASGVSSSAPSKDGTPLHMATTADVHNDEDDHKTTNDMDNYLIEQMRTVLENQEMEIVTLKEQLAIRSAEYARLAAQYDPYKLQTTLSHSGMPAITSVASNELQPKAIGAVGDSTMVPKSELDFALYMLHQRDMRCDEMTMEVVALLEERDTLQIKLSNTLRQIEDMRSKNSSIEASSETDAAAAPAIQDSPNKLIVTDTKSDDSSQELIQKLSQLQTVSHSKDKIIKEEREKRLRQMEKIQQDVAKIPPAAISELVGTNLTQTGMSPSSTLLNWLWGNNPELTGDDNSNK